MLAIGLALKKQFHLCTRRCNVYDSGIAWNMWWLVWTDARGISGLEQKVKPIKLPAWKQFLEPAFYSRPAHKKTNLNDNPLVVFLLPEVSLISLGLWKNSGKS